MSFSASSVHSDERVLEVQFTEDTISVGLVDGRVITVPLVWYPRLLGATASPRENWKICRRRLRNLLARHRRGSQYRRIAARRTRTQSWLDTVRRGVG